MSSFRTQDSLSPLFLPQCHGETAKSPGALSPEFLRLVPNSSFFLKKTIVCVPFPKILGLVLMVKVCSFFRKIASLLLGRIDFKIAGIRFGLELGRIVNHQIF